MVYACEDALKFKAYDTVCREAACNWEGLFQIPGGMMKDLSLLRILVSKWTKKAQNSAYSDIERATFYECAEELHRAIQFLEEDNH